MHDKELLLRLANNYLKNGSTQEAITQFEKYIAKYPDDLINLNTLGDLYAKQGLNEKAAFCFMKIAESYNSNGFLNRAIAMYKKILKLDIQEPLILLNIADLYAKRKIFVEARNLYKQIIEVYRAQNQPDKVLAVTEKMAGLEPENISSQMELARAYEQAGRKAKASDAFLHIGSLYLKTGQTEEAAAVLEKSIHHNPINTQALTQLVKTLSELNQHERALQTINNLLERRSENEELIEMQAKLLIQLGRLKEAENAYLQLFYANEQKYEDLLKLCKSYINNSQFDNALKLLDVLLDHLIRTDTSKKATTLIKEILKRDQTHLPAIKRLAYIYMQTNKTRSLIATLKMLVNVAQDQGHEAEAVKALEKLIELEPGRASHKKRLADINSSKEITKEQMRPQNLRVTPVEMRAFYATASEDSLSDSAPQEMSGDHTTELLESMILKNPSILEAQIRLLEQLIKKNPDFVEARIKLKALYEDCNQPQEAAVQALEIAHFYREKGDHNQVIKFIEDACRLDPSTEALIDELLPPAPPVFEVQNSEDSLDAESVNPNSSVEISLFNPDQESLEAFFNSKEVSTYSDLPSEENLPINVEAIVNLLKKDRLLEKEWRRAARYEMCLGIALGFIDAYAEYEEMYGEKRAEECSRKIMEKIEKTLFRAADTAIYISKGQYILYLPDTPLDGVRIVVSRIQEAIAKLKLPHAPDIGGSLNLSFAIASVKANSRASLTELINRVAENLRRALTKTGRKQIVQS